MSAQDPFEHYTRSDAPFGTSEPRSPLPVYVYAALFVIWVGVLIWMAASQVNP